LASDQAVVRHEKTRWNIRPIVLILFPSSHGAVMVERLCDFPWVIVRVDRPLCPHRQGQYRLARLAEKFGADILLCDLIAAIAGDCLRRSLPWERSPGEYDPKCEARFSDLETPSRPPPDLPPRMRRLTMIQGGKG
jgi:hypothetical protein